MNFRDLNFPVGVDEIQILRDLLQLGDFVVVLADHDPVDVRLALFYLLEGLRFRVQGFGFWIEDVGLRVQGFGFEIQGWGFGSRAKGLGFGVGRVQGYDSGSRVNG